MKEIAYPLVSSIVTWLLSHYYHRKKNKSELEDILMERLNDLSEKYVKLNELYIDLVDEMDGLRAENKQLRNQITCLKKKGKRNV
jgi:cell division protein FtsB